MTYGDKIRLMNDEELAHFLSFSVIPENESEPMFILGMGHFAYEEDLRDKLGEEITQKDRKENK